MRGLRLLRLPWVQRANAAALSFGPPDALGNTYANSRRVASAMLRRTLDVRRRILMSMMAGARRVRLLDHVHGGLLSSLLPGLPLPHPCHCLCRRTFVILPGHVGIGTLRKLGNFQEPP
ncbi:unnamed protein product [Symbiodinium natans]|uniref:Uncharacterized protein n=1 Tax=Symbiodinium natans TaxID=878477 RepID=A0A812SJF3_9DINO|nr:unnamed protein product [Symbiodinium natans]